MQWLNAKCKNFQWRDMALTNEKNKRTMVTINTQQIGTNRTTNYKCSKCMREQNCVRSTRKLQTLCTKPVYTRVSLLKTKISHILYLS